MTELVELAAFRITKPPQCPVSLLVITRCQQTAQLPRGGGTCGEVFHLQAGSSCIFPLTARQTQPGQYGYHQDPLDFIPVPLTSGLACPFPSESSGGGVKSPAVGDRGMEKNRDPHFSRCRLLEGLSTRVGCRLLSVSLFFPPDLFSPLQPPDEHTEHSGGSDLSAPNAFHAVAQWRKLLTLKPVAPTVQFSPLIAPCLSLAE